MTMNRQWRLSDAPIDRMPTPANFTLHETPVPVPQEGQALVRTVYLSLDPYQWGYKVNGVEKSGDLLHARTVVKVVESRNPAYRKGDFVHCTNGWQDYGLIGDGVPDHPYMKTRVIDPALGPVSTALGVLGMNGLTAWAGLVEICRARAGETVVVSAATGGVGQIVGQIARRLGCRTVGIVSTPEKMRVATAECGYDAAVSHLSETLEDDLAAACPDGVNVYFENVGGRSFDATARLFNQDARMVICGLIGERPGGSSARGKEALLARSADLRAARNVSVTGMLVGDFVDDHFDAFLARMSEWYRAGQVTYREDIRDGLDNAPACYADMMAGGNMGKTLVRVSPEDA